MRRSVEQRAELLNLGGRTAECRIISCHTPNKATEYIREDVPNFRFVLVDGKAVIRRGALVDEVGVLEQGVLQPELTPLPGHDTTASMSSDS
jgi:hypothetical protein